MKTTTSLIFAASMALWSTGAVAGWRYQTDIDKMTGKAARYAQIESNNSLALDFPYRGSNYARLDVRQHPKYGLNVIFSVDKGQILCRSYDGCSVAVKFDDGKPQTFTAVPPADHDSKAIFLNDERRFIAAAQKAKRILVQVTFYQNGEQVLEFMTSEPLEWDKKPPAKKK